MLGNQDQQYRHVFLPSQSLHPKRGSKEERREHIYEKYNYKEAYDGNKICIMNDGGQLQIEQSPLRKCHPGKKLKSESRETCEVTTRTQADQSVAGKAPCDQREGDPQRDVGGTVSRDQATQML